jgi:hypothetical protein
VKYSKVAAAVAGSVMAVGVGAPAFASGNSVDARNMSTRPTSVNTGVDQALDEQPLQKVAGTVPADSTMDTLGEATDDIKGGAPAQELAGDAVDATRNVTSSGLAEAVPGASLLGGLPVGGLPVGGLLGGLPAGGLLGGLGG